jgi:hypothetical protein
MIIDDVAPGTDSIPDLLLGRVWRCRGQTYLVAGLVRCVPSGFVTDEYKNIASCTARNGNKDLLKKLENVQFSVHLIPKIRLLQYAK